DVTALANRLQEVRELTFHVLPFALQCLPPVQLVVSFGQLYYLLQRFRRQGVRLDCLQHRFVHHPDGHMERIAAHTIVPVAKAHVLRDFPSLAWANFYYKTSTADGARSQSREQVPNLAPGWSPGKTAVAKAHRSALGCGTSRRHAIP